MNYVSKIKVRYIVNLICVIGIASAVFYWYEWRPVRIYRMCADRGQDYLESMLKKDTRERPDGEEQIRVYRFLYEKCLHKKGLK